MSSSKPPDSPHLKAPTNSFGSKPIERDGAYRWNKDLGPNKRREEELLEALGEHPDEPGIAEKIDKNFYAHQLNAGDFTLNKQEARDLCRTDLDFLAATAMPLIFEALYPPVLLAAWTLLQQVSDRSFVAKNKYPQIALGIPRGHGKTTLIKLYILWVILFTDRRFILVVCNTEQHAINIISDVCDMLDESNIKLLFGDWKLGAEVNRQDFKKFSFLNRPINLVAIGWGGSLRGMNIKNERPDVMVFDDIQSKEDSESRVTSDALMKWFVGTALKAKSPSGCINIYAANMYPTPNSILLKLKDNAGWTKFISGAILADGSALWPELKSIKDLVQELDNDIAMGHPEIFFSEVLNDVNVGVNTRTDLSLIDDWLWPDDQRPVGSFIIIDPASNKVGGDDVSIGYFEVHDGKPGLRDLYEQNVSPGETIKQAIRMAIRNKCKVIAVESTSYQFSLLYWFTVIAEQIGVTGIHFVDVYSGNYSKNARITETLKMLTSKELYVHGSVRSKVIRQITHWKPLQRNNEDGILDLLTYATKVLELYAPLIMVEDSLEIQDASHQEVMEDNHAF